MQLTRLDSECTDEAIRFTKTCVVFFPQQTLLRLVNMPQIFRAVH